MKTKNKIELLAPAGSYESLLAAFGAGADAVYVGGRQFGARAYANNLTEEELCKAIDLAHLQRKKLYLTVNTLLKTQELRQRLIPYLIPLYEAGLDGVIVQDAGVIACIREHLPELPIHISTQMTVTGVDSARLLQSQGAVRVVPARELSLEELRQIKQETDLELEVFIHGALCYCYSGQCLFSSLLGGRSGNRGRCAQPCRLPYQINHQSGYYLSPKDLCGLSAIPDLAKIGVDSLKIEGRMKSTAYTAGVVQIYRKYLDLYAKNPKEYQVQQEDIQRLLDLYNRGGMTDGYFYRHNSASMLSNQRSNHFGLPLGHAALSRTPETQNRIPIRLETSVHKGDALELRDSDQKLLSAFLADRHYAANETILVCPKKEQSQGKRQNKSVSQKQESHQHPAKQEICLYRMNNTEWKEQLLKFLVPAKRLLTGNIFLREHVPAMLYVQDPEDPCLQVIVTGPEALPAKSQPLTKEVVCAQLNKTGSTEFLFQELNCEIEGALFLPRQALNAMRRDALLQIKELILQKYRRTFQKPVMESGAGSHTLCQTTGNVSSHMAEQSSCFDKRQSVLPDDSGYLLAASVETWEQLTAIASCPDIGRIDIESFLFFEETARSDSSFLELCKALQAEGKQVFFRFPAVFRTASKKRMEREWELLQNVFDGFVLRTADAYAWLLSQQCKRKELVLDFSVYCFTREAADFWKSCSRSSIGISLTAPVELNYNELKANAGIYQELVVYGRYPMMVSAGCLQKTYHALQNGQDSCKKDKSMLYLNDRYHKQFPVRMVCQDCYNIIYNSLPVSLLENKHDVDRLHVPVLRLLFTTEEGSLVRKIAEQFTNVYLHGGSEMLPVDSYTRGHFKRGVE